MVEHEHGESRAPAARIVKEVFAGNKEQAVSGRDILLGEARQALEFRNPEAANRQPGEFRQGGVDHLPLRDLGVAQALVAPRVIPAGDQQRCCHQRYGRERCRNP